MSCPFLREGRARYCHAAPLRKLILDGPGTAGAGRCDTPEHRNCPLVTAVDGAVSCPHLEGIHVQYCGATGVPKLVPFSEAGLSRCGGPGFRYCELYLSMARPHASLKAPSNLYFTPNHFWLDADEGGHYQVGLDAFVGQVAGSVDRVVFLTPVGTNRPAVVLSVGDTDWTMEFPIMMRVTSMNGHLRRDPNCLVEDPYGAGWLFEGWEVHDNSRNGLLHGGQAAPWQTSEEERLAGMIHEFQNSNGSQIGTAMGDGGFAAPGVARLMNREEGFRVYQEFFASARARKKEQ